MKATLALVACLLTAGFLSAAAVEGNNTAVVIRKNVVESDTGYQFLCVPVDGLDIANGDGVNVKLSTLLPADTVTDGTTVTLVGKVDPSGNPIVYTFSNGQWPDVDLEGGQIFWVHAGGDDTTVDDLTLVLADEPADGGDSSPKTIIFCGQNRDAQRTAYSTLSAGQIVALKNDSSSAISLNEAVLLSDEEVPTRTNDTIMTIEKGSSNYKQYFYRKGKWRTTSADSTIATEVDGDAKIIAPGEAFYYYKATK